MKAIGSAGFLIAGIALTYAQADIAPTGTLRAAYLATNPAQAIRDPHTGEMRGVSFDLARELAKRIGKPLDFKPTASPPMVIDAVRSGRAEKNQSTLFRIAADGSFKSWWEARQ